MSEWIILDGELREGSTVELQAGGQGASYGFGVFETIKFMEGRPCFFAEHEARLLSSAKAAGLELGLAEGTLRAQAQTLLDASGRRSGAFKILALANGKAARVAMYLRPESGPYPERWSLRVSKVAKASQAFCSRHKTTNYMENLLEFTAARNLGYDECLFFNELGQATEGATSNFYFLKDGCLHTPARECGLLDGVIRGQILALAEEDGLRTQEGCYTLEEVMAADEAFISNSGAGFASVSEIRAESRKWIARDPFSHYGDRMSERLAKLERESF